MANFFKFSVICFGKTLNCLFSFQNEFYIFCLVFLNCFVFEREDPCGWIVVNLDVVLFCPWPCVVKIGLAVGSVELSISI